MLTAMANIPTSIALAAAAVATWYFQPFKQDESEGRDTPSALMSSSEVHFTVCDESWVRDDCVVDGDTFWLNGDKIRIANIDTPETHPARCDYEQDLGMRATYRLQELLNEGSVSLRSIDRNRDVYGRLLRTVSGPGGDIGDQLVSEGLARHYGNGRRPWC